ncbi:uncharacterized protein [Periplaneta americana]|uniref:uncharacterized protein isoform X5 n=1 Tax=Periplaneta americana TaxID=6978 RepID=UPI0037E823A4
MKRWNGIDMDVIKAEPEVDPLATHASDNSYTEEKKPFSEGGRFLDFHGTWIKTECGDQSYDVISEVKLEETAATRNDAVVKSETEQDSCNIDVATEEMKLEEMVEDNEVLPDRFAV